MSKTTNKHAPEVRERAVRSRAGPSVALGSGGVDRGQIGCAAQALHSGVKETELDSGVRGGAPSEIAAQLKALELKNCELRQAHCILRKASAHFAQVGLNPVYATIAFIDDQRAIYGVEPICKALPIAPRTYYKRAAQRRDPLRLSERASRDLALRVEVRRVLGANYRVYGARKVWRQLQREGFDVARCTVPRLMQAMSLAGVIRDKPVRTTISDRSAPCPRDHVNRQFRAPAPDMLRVSDFTYVATWAGFVYFAFVIDTFTSRIVRWRASRTAHAGFVLDALEQALHDRRPTHSRGLIHHSDCGNRYVSIKYTERLAEAGI